MKLFRLLQPVKNAQRRLPFLSIRYWVILLLFLVAIVATYILRQINLVIEPYGSSLFKISVLFGSFAYLQVFYLSFCHLTNKNDILYLRAYADTMIDLPKLLSENASTAAFNLVLGSQKSIQHVTYQYLASCYDMIALMPPPNNELEERLDAYQLRQPEAQYLLRTINDADWRETVSELISSCRAVVVECSHLTVSLQWEITQVLKMRGASKIILVADNWSNHHTTPTPQQNIQTIKNKVLRSYGQVHGIVLRNRKFDIEYAATLLTHLRKIAPKTGLERLSHLALFCSRRCIGFTMSGALLWGVGEVIWLIWTVI